MERTPVGPNDVSSRSPRLRKVSANMLTDLGWLFGVFNLPPHQSLIDFPAPGVQVIKFTNVRLPSVAERVPFVALRREAVRLIEPTLNDEMVEAPGSIGRSLPHEVACLLPEGRLQGTLEVLVNVRVSDYLRQQANLIVMRRCVLAAYGESLDSPKARQLSTVVVNLAAAVGVAEWEASG
jgi:hypothetical protein